MLLAAGATAVFSISVAMYQPMGREAAAFEQPATPAAQPKPAQSQPAQSQPAQAQPQPAQPTNPPTQPSPLPTRPPGIDPAAQPPPEANASPQQEIPGTATVTPGGREAAVLDASGRRFVRPFSFQSPQAEGQFNQSSKRLLAMEQRMERSNQELLRKLGEARQLSGDKQNTALMDILQQVLQDRAMIQQYLVHSRGLWTGDLPRVEETEGSAADGQGSDTFNHLGSRVPNTPKEGTSNQPQATPSNTPSTPPSPPAPR